MINVGDLLLLKNGRDVVKTARVVELASTVPYVKLQLDGCEPAWFELNSGGYYDADTATLWNSIELLESSDSAELSVLLMGLRAIAGTGYCKDCPIRQAGRCQMPGAGCEALSRKIRKVGLLR